MSNIRDIISAALGKKKAKLVLKNCKIINVFTEEIIEGDVQLKMIR
jgi:adenine deaminase